MLEPKSTVTETKNTLGGFKSPFEQVGERISELEDSTIEMNKSEE